MLLNPEYEIVSDRWEHSYTREKAAYPIESVRDNKFWINVARVDNTLGDRKLTTHSLWYFRVKRGLSKEISRALSLKKSPHTNNSGTHIR